MVPPEPAAFLDIRKKMRCLFVLISFAIYAIIPCEMLDGGCRVFYPAIAGFFVATKGRPNENTKIFTRTYKPH